MIEGLPAPVPFEGVIFDFHGTLFGPPDPIEWMRAAFRHLDQGGMPPDLDATNMAGLAGHLGAIWEHASEIDPVGERDLNPGRHREVFCRAVELWPAVDREFAVALHAVMGEQSFPYDDAVPVLRALKAHGIRTAVLSNIGWDIRPRLLGTGVSAFLDDVVLSYEVGMKKPDSRIFALALDRLDLPARRVLMVGDSWLDDVGGAILGLRTLVLPGCVGRVHGLASVLHLVLGACAR